MSFPGIFRRLFTNNGAGPLLRGDIIPPCYAVCSTAAGTAAKTVSIPGITLKTGVEITVRFSATNTAANPTLNLNSTGAKAIRYRNTAISAGYLAANRTYRFVYDGTYWQLVGDVDTTPAAATAAPKAPASSAAVGTSAKYAREDHVHPVQESVTGSSGSCTGNAASASKLATKRTIGGVQFDGSANIHHYGVCSTAAGTAAKVVALSGFVLATGAEVTVRFTVTNTASSPTLNVNGTGAKPIQYRNAAISAGYLAANRVYKFVYDGGAWELVGDINIDTNTTYAAATTSNLGLVKVGTNISVSEGTISVANGSTSAKGVVQLSSATNSTSTTLAATASAVKAAYDKGVSAATAASKAQTAADAAKTAAEAAGGNNVKAYVTDTWKSSDGISWYRKWSDGFIEQGGYHQNTSVLDTVTLHTPFKTSEYTLIVSDYNTTEVGGGHATSPYGCGKTTTAFKISQVKNTYEAFWYAAGY